MCENFLYVFKGARSAPGPAGRCSWEAPREDGTDPSARSSRRSLGRPFGGTLRAWAPPAALRPCRATAASARESSPRPAAPTQRRNDQRQARELQKRAILPALQCEAGQDHPQGRFASHVMACGHPCA